MKNLFKLSILLLSLSLFQITTSLAQDNTKQGVIAYKIDAQSDNPQVASMLSGSKATFTFKEGKVRVDVDIAVSKTTTVVKDGKVTTLADVMGQKYKMVTDTSAPDPKAAKDYKVDYTKETKTIAGYECTKVVIKPKEGNDIIAYVTDKITAKNKSFPYKEVKGFPMEYQQAAGGGIMLTFSVTSVDLTTPVSDDLFAVSTDGYTETTPEQFMKMFGGK